MHWYQLLPSISHINNALISVIAKTFTERSTVRLFPILACTPKQEKQQQTQQTARSIPKIWKVQIKTKYAATIGHVHKLLINTECRQTKNNNNRKQTVCCCNTKWGREKNENKEEQKTKWEKLSMSNYWDNYKKLKKKKKKRRVIHSLNRIRGSYKKIQKEKEKKKRKKIRRERKKKKKKEKKINAILTAV